MKSVAKRGEYEKNSNSISATDICILQVTCENNVSSLLNEYDFEISSSLYTSDRRIPQNTPMQYSRMVIFIFSRG